jgi:outer membrane biogenesis lipoprotein LolB
MLRILIISVVSALLAGCASHEERAASIANADDAACQSYGAQLGTQAYFQCRMAKDQQRQANNAALAGAILSRPQPQPYVLPMPRSY